MEEDANPCSRSCALLKRLLEFSRSGLTRRPEGTKSLRNEEMMLADGL